MAVAANVDAMTANMGLTDTMVRLIVHAIMTTAVTVTLAMMGQGTKIAAMTDTTTVDLVTIAVDTTSLAAIDGVGVGLHAVKTEMTVATALNQI